MSRAAGKGSAVGLAVAMGIAAGFAAGGITTGSGAAPAPQVRSAPRSAASVALGPLDEPSAVDIAPDGSIYVAESGASRIAIFDLRGRLLRRVGRPGDGNGELRRPRGLAIAPDGRVYVADTGHHRIQVFSASGAFEKSWGRRGAGPGEFNEPLGVAADARRVYVADARNNRVQIFDREGQFLLYVWSYGTREGQLDRPVDVAVDDKGAFYVSDQGNSRIQKFDAEGKFLAAWGGWGPYPGLLAEPGGLALRRGRLLVADTHNHRVQELGANGTVMGVWDEDTLLGAGGPGTATAATRASSTSGPSSRTTQSTTTKKGSPAATMPAKAKSVSAPGDRGAPRPPEPVDLAPLPTGDGIVVCDADADACRFVPQGPAAPRAGGSSPMTSTARAATLSGSTLVVAAGSAGFLVLDVAGPRPSVVGVFGGYGREALQFVRNAGAALDVRKDAVLVSDGGNYRLAWFDLRRGAEGQGSIDPARTRFVRSIFFGDEEALVFGPIKWTLVPALLEPGPIARDARGVTYILDTLGARVVVLDEAFHPVGSWGTRARAEKDAALVEPVDLALSPSGDTLYVLDAGTGRIRAFDGSGSLLFAWGRLGTGRDAFVRPTSLASCGDGTIVVADRAGRVSRFTSRGQPLGGWGKPGLVAGALDHPEKILGDARGRVYVLDSAGRRLQAFSTTGTFLWDLDVIAAAVEARRARTTSIAKATASGIHAPSTDLASSTASTKSDGVPAGCARRLTSNGGAYTVCWSPSVDPPPHNAPFTVDVTVYDAAKPAAPAEMVALTVDAAMPEHGHGLVQPPVVRAIGFSVPKEKLPDHALVHGAAVGNGTFEVEGLRLHMPGRWEIYFDVGRGAVIERTQVEIVLD